MTMSTTKYFWLPKPNPTLTIQMADQEKTRIYSGTVSNVDFEGTDTLSVVVDELLYKDVSESFPLFPLLHLHFALMNEMDLVVEIAAVPFGCEYYHCS